MKKYSIGFILIEIAVVLVISCIPTIFVFLYTDPEKNLTIPAFIVFLFLAFILHTSLANRILFPIAKKTDVNDLTDARSGYIKGPFDGTRYVYYQFTYKNKRMRIPTFTAKNMHLLSATIVKDAISKAECFSDSVQKLQKKSMKTER